MFKYSNDKKSSNYGTEGRRNDVHQSNRLNITHQAVEDGFSDQRGDPRNMLTA